MLNINSYNFLYKKRILFLCKIRFFTISLLSDIDCLIKVKTRFGSHSPYINTYWKLVGIKKQHIQKKPLQNLITGRFIKIQPELLLKSSENSHKDGQRLFPILLH